MVFVLLHGSDPSAHSLRPQFPRGQLSTPHGAHNTDVGVRQWVLTVPWEMRLPMARDPTLYTKVSQVLFAAVRAWLRATSGVAAGEGERVEVGAVSVQHRFGGSMNLSPHWHMLVLDGVYRCRDDGSTPVFVPVRAPTRAELEAIVGDVVARLGRSRRWRAMGDGAGAEEQDAMTRLLRGAAEGYPFT